MRHETYATELSVAGTSACSYHAISALGGSLPRWHGDCAAVPAAAATAFAGTKRHMNQLARHLEVRLT
jgi:hypothetical protein